MPSDANQGPEGGAAAGDGVLHVLEHGGDVEFTTDRGTAPADRIEILTNGYVVLYFKHSYSKEVHPERKIDSIHTHTSAEEENAEWW